MSEGLYVERAWLVECDRCANEASSFESEMHEARGDFASRGWAAEEDGDQFCPACSGTDEGGKR